jgi:hypothetical protein
MLTLNLMMFMLFIDGFYLQLNESTDVTLNVYLYLYKHACHDACIHKFHSRCYLLK